MKALKLTLSAAALAAITLAAGCTPTGSDSTSKARQPAGVEQYIAGAQAYGRGDVRGAEQTLRQAVVENPNLIAARNLLGDLYRKQGDYHQAAAQYQALIQLDPYGPQNHYKLGLSYHFLKRIQDAIDSYQRSLALDPDYGPANASLGAAYLSEGKVPQAIEKLEHATRTTPDSAAAWSNLGLALDGAGQYQRAETAYRTALELDDQPSTRLNYANNLISQGRPTDAIAILESVINRANSPIAQKRLGDAYAATKDYAAADTAYQSALKMNPRYTGAINAQASILIDRYRAGAQLDTELREQAVKLWKQSLSIDPTQTQVRQLVDAWGNSSVFK